VVNPFAHLVLQGVALGVRLDVPAARTAPALAIPVPVVALAAVVPIAPMLIGGAHVSHHITIRRCESVARRWQDLVASSLLPITGVT
jgi:hypothetical protein